MHGGFGFAQVLMLAVMTGGASSTDLVSLVEPAHYFQHREWEPSVDKMADMIGDDPKDAKTQIVQLTCLRYLADEAVALKKSPRYAEHRQMLEAIAQGKKAQDPLGFAKEYANLVLLKLDNAKPAAVKRRPLREEAFGWFPASVTIAGALDLKQGRQADGAVDPIKLLLKKLPERERKQMYDHFEKCGNIRVERVSFGYADGTGKRDGKIFARFTGKGNQDWMADMFTMMGLGRQQTKQMKDEKDTPITLMQERNGPPVIMLVGNTDLLIVGFEGNNGQQEDLVTEVLEARSKKKANAAAGPLRERLAKVPDKAVALLVGSVPDQLKRELGFAFEALPTGITAFIERDPKGLDVQFEASMANAEDAGKFVQKAGSLRKEGIKAIRDEMQNPRQPNGPPIPFLAMINLLEGLQVQDKNDKVQARTFVPDGLIQQVMSSWMMFGAREFAPQKCGE